MSSESVLCIHQNQLFRQCLSWILDRDDRFKAFDISEVDHRKTNVEQLIRLKRPTIALIDVSLPHRRAVELTRNVRSTVGASVILLCSADCEHDPHQRDLLLECVEVGAQGYVLEESSLDDLKAAIDNVVKGQVFCSPRLMKAMMEQFAVLAKETRWRRQTKTTSLTKREQEILQWIAEGFANKEIAAELSLSLYTVKNHVHKILSKLQADDRREAVRRALEHRWVSIPKAGLS